ncbi:glycosyl hydrolase family 88 [Dysgonomonas alginatilytica]|uniref:Glycosyl hydrolase family 88 n=1 Tax=Dysgonomonas alginatilytica TaxID=1605892 RepID=A0A2V3PJE9_9BACT|nr:glycoside hydrolase family 88 protein [Dysgonomonas alginatilytica]PXV58413.1 glycosyl hydrolase family 88 [Dysgonomonas alginatilytica]
MKTSTIKVFSLFIAGIFFVTSCKDEKNKEKVNFIQENVDFAKAQTLKMLEATGEPTGKNYPRTANENGTLRVTDMYDWTPGFFPGSLWYLYELTGDTTWRNSAEKWTHSLEPLKTYTGNHDLGFMMYCSYGNAARLAPKPEYKDILIESAQSLSTRYNDKIQSIKSWNGGRAWGDTTKWAFPVIIDNMMNLELLFNASKISGDKKFYDIAVKHANTTLKNHFREDFGSFHVLDYDTITGDVRFKGTAQGFSDNSTWARGQAWAIYGFTMVYRETKDSSYLNTAKHLADYFIKNLPADFVPVWDFNVGQAGYTPQGKSYAVEFQEKLKDASAAAIVSSALFELGEMTKNKSYTDTATKMLYSLASPNYRAALGTNANFLIMHCVGSIPHRSEIDVPLCYADYYFLEALVRYKNLK